MSSLIEKISEINDCVSLICEDLKVISDKLKDFSDESYDEVKNDEKCFLCDGLIECGYKIAIGYDSNKMYFEPKFCPNCGRKLFDYKKFNIQPISEDHMIKMCDLIKNIKI